MYPNGKPFLREIGERGIPLLCKRSCQKPRLHHIDVVFLRSDRCDERQNVGRKGFVKVISHEDTHAVTNGISMIGSDPFFRHHEAFFGIFGKNFRIHRVARRPVIHIREKAVERRLQSIDIPYLFHQKRMEIIFIIIAVGKRRAKRRRIVCFGKSARKSTQNGRTHAEDTFFFNIGNEKGLKIPIGFISKGE